MTRAQKKLEEAECELEAQRARVEYWARRARLGAEDATPLPVARPSDAKRVAPSETAAQKARLAILRSGDFQEAKG